jgi:hypothetical protein
MSTSKEDKYYRELKKVIKPLIHFYYMSHAAGGCLHIALDDGNLADENLYFCQRLAEQRKDYMGYMIATTLRYFTEEEREKMYDNEWE